jgi:hypothetical protein
MPTIEELGKKVKAKYPGQYDDMPDAQVGQRVKAKYPGAYDDFTDAPQASAPAERSAGGFLSNVASSAGKLVTDTASAIAHPVDTAMGIGKLAVGLAPGAAAIQSMIPGEQPPEQAVNALTDFVKQRYGGIEEFKKTAYEDPVGMLADISTLLSGSGAVLKGASVGGKVAQAGKVAATVGDAINPIRAAAAPVKAVARGAVKAAGSVTGIDSLAPERLYQSALKPRLGMGPEKVREVVQTGLREGIPVSKEGLAQVQDLMDGINQEIAGKITAKAAAGAKVSSADVATKLDDVRAFFKDTVAPQGMLKEIDALQKQFQAAHGKTIPVDKAQKLKQNTYVLLKRAYGEMKSAQVEGQKALARGLKDEIVKIVPEVADLNARESKLIGLESALERYVAREGNHQLTGIGTPIAAGGVKAVTGSTAVSAVAGLARAALENPAIKSKLAIAIAKAQARGKSASAASRATGKVLNPRAILAARLQEAIAQ